MFALGYQSVNRIYRLWLERKCLWAITVPHKVTQQSKTPVNNKKREKWEKERTKHLSQLRIVNEVRSVPVDEGAQSQAILPAEPWEAKWKGESSRYTTERKKWEKGERKKHMKMKRSVQVCSNMLNCKKKWENVLKMYLEKNMKQQHFGVVYPPDVEVLHVHVPVGGSLPLAPQQETFLSRCLY